MSNLILPRRGFLTGFGALLAAPSIVKASNLMPVSNIDHILYPLRGLIDYNVMSDTLMIRIDRANFLLPVPKHVCGYISDKEILRFFKADDLEKIKPIGNNLQQRNISFNFTEEQFGELKIKWNQAYQLDH